MEKAIPAKKSDFKRLTGLSFEMYCDFITRYVNNYLPNNSKYRGLYINHNYNQAYQQLMDEWNDDLFIYNVMDYLGNYQLMTWQDLTRISSYGVVNRNGQEEMVIIDFGLSEDVWNNHYNKFK